MECQVGVCLQQVQQGPDVAGLPQQECGTLTVQGWAAYQPMAAHDFAYGAVKACKWGTGCSTQRCDVCVVCAGKGGANFKDCCVGSCHGFCPPLQPLLLRAFTKRCLTDGVHGVHGSLKA